MFLTLRLKHIFFYNTIGLVILFPLKNPVGRGARRTNVDEKKEYQRFTLGVFLMTNSVAFYNEDLKMHCIGVYTKFYELFILNKAIL